MIDLKLQSKTWTVDNTRLRFLLHRESFSQDIAFNKNKPLHSHSYYEILFSRSDSCEMLFDDHKLPFHQNSVVIIHPRHMHRALTPHQECLFSIGFTYSKDTKASSDCDLFGALERHFSNKAYVMFPPLDSFATSFTKLEQASNTDEPFGAETMFAIFLRILFRMLTISEQDCLEEKTLSAPLEEPKSAYHVRATVETLQKIDHILNHYFTTSVTAAEVSKQVYLSERQINRYIESQYSQTFQQRKTYLRINAACRLLVSTELSIADISAQVGYTSINTFYSAFKQQLGMTPNEFRIKFPREIR